MGTISAPPSLAAGTCTALVGTATAPATTGAYYVGAIADRYYAVPELIENNNNSAAGNLIGVGSKPDFIVTAVSDTTLTVTGSLSDETASGDETIVVYAPKTGLTTLNVNTAERSFTRTNGSFLEDGFIAGQRIAASGFAANNNDYTVVSISETGRSLVVDKPLADGDATGGGDEQPLGLGKRGLLTLDAFVALRQVLYNKATKLGTRIEMPGVVTGLMEKILRGQMPSDGEIGNFPQRLSLHLDRQHRPGRAALAGIRTGSQQRHV